MRFAFCLGFRNWHVAHLRRCVESIRARTVAPIVLCDLGSDSLELVEAAVAPFGVRLVSEPLPEWSRSRALNVAASLAPPSTTHLVFTDADMVFPEMWFMHADVAAIRSPAALWLTRSRDVGEAAMRHFGRWPDGTSCDSVFVSSDPVMPSLDHWLLEHSEPHATDLGQGAAMVVPREWFVRVGGFDERYWVWGCEDNDLTQRAEWDGVPVGWIPEAWVAHQWHRRDWPTPEQFKQVRRNREYFYQRLADGGPVVRNRKEVAQ